MIPSPRVSILADSHYSSMLPECDRLQNEIQSRFGGRIARLATRFSSIRGVLGWWIGRDYDFVATVSHGPGGRWLVFLTAWLGGHRRRKIIFLEFISCPDRLINRLIFTVWFPLIFRPAVRRTIVAAHVMASVEPDYYSKLLGLPASLFNVIQLPLMDDEGADRTYHAADNIVFSSGRGSSDWATLFRAALGANWNLSVVCSKHDRKLVERLNRNVGGAVRSEISPAEHAQLMGAAAVYVVPLRKRPISCGQLRMRNAISAGTPIVCTRADGLSGYAIHNQTACVVDEGDYAALRREVDKLLSDPQSRRTLAARAREFARTRTVSHFANALSEWVSRVAAEAFHEAPSSESPQITINQGP